MRTKIGVALALLLSSMLAFGCAASKGYNLKMKFTEGRVDHYLQTSVSEVNTQMLGQAITVTQKMNVYFDQTVLEATADGGHVIQQTLTRIVMNTDMAFMSVTIDTAVPEDRAKPLGEVMNALVDKPLLMKINAEGDIVDIKGLEKVQEAVESSELMKNAEGADPKANLKELFEGEFYEKMALIPMAPGNIQVGHTWTKERTRKVPQIGELQYKETMTLESVEHGVAKVVTTAEFDQGESGKLTLDIKTPSMNAKADILNLSMDGEYFLDLDAGIMIRRQNILQFEMKMVGAAAGAVPLAVRATESTVLME